MDPTCHMCAFRLPLYHLTVSVVCTLITTLGYAANQSARGNDHIYKMPLSRYQPVVLSEHKGQHQRGDSEFFQSGITESSFQRLR